MDIETINLDTLGTDTSQSIKLDNITSTIGMELLMNDKKKRRDDNSEEGNMQSDINLGDLHKLEEELNDLSPTTKSLPTTSLKEVRSTLFSNNINLDISDTNNTSEHNDDDNNTNNVKNPMFKLNKNDDNKNNTTWDGMSKINNIPIDPSKPVYNAPKQSVEETLREKFKYLRKLEELEKKGVNLSKKYTMESSLLEMKGEYETLINEKERKNSCKFQGRMLMAAITGLEFLNQKFDPFDLHLDGWAEQINENVDDYDEIFEELHNKYKSKATMAPELKLLFQLGGSAIMIHMTNTMFKSAMPGMDDIMRQNPELMQQFTQAAVNQMGQENPGFGGFMNNMMNPDITPSNGSAPPPPPVRTQGPDSIRHPQRRPDIGFSRGPEDGINIMQSGAPANPVQQTNRTTGKREIPSVRQEMKGPSDISNLLSGLKSKEISVSNESEHISMNDASSTISISDLKELNNTNLPKKSRRRVKSDKNTISLDI